MTFGITAYTVDAVVLDIEGTTSATGFVVDVLYPYSRKRFGALLSERASESAVAKAIAQVRELIGEPGADAVRIEQALNSWLDEDRKATPLKTLQGIVWSEGFAAGDLVSHFYEDVVPELRRWHAAGVRLHVYSSGSVAAQRAWFAHSPAGDLLPLVDGLYDTYPDRLRPILPCYRSAFRALTDWVEYRAAPPASGTVPRPASGDLVNSCALH